MDNIGVGRLDDGGAKAKVGSALARSFSGKCAFRQDVKGEG